MLNICLFQFNSYGCNLTFAFVALICVSVGIQASAVNYEVYYKTKEEVW